MRNLTDVLATLAANRLPPEAVAVPTHTFMVVLVQQPDPERNVNDFEVMCFIVPNRQDLPMPENGFNFAAETDDIVRQMQAEGGVMVTLKEIEALTGARFFKGLDPAVRAAIENKPPTIFTPEKKIDYITQIDIKDLDSPELA